MILPGKDKKQGIHTAAKPDRKMVRIEFDARALIPIPELVPLGVGPVLRQEFEFAAGREGRCRYREKEPGGNLFARRR